MGLRAYASQRVVTPGGIRAAALLVEGTKIRDVSPINDVPPGILVADFGHAAILPGLVDSHVHINEPGRTEWEGFRTATRAAAAGGYTMLVDMPLNCIPPTTNVAALDAKRNAARGQCHVDWAAWGGLVQGNHEQIEALAGSGARGFKCFLVHPGIDEFTMVGDSELRRALPSIARSDLPLLVHAELPGPIEAATAQLSRHDWSRYATYLHSRPDEAELSAIHLMLSLCREFKFRLHIVHLATSLALGELNAARREGLPVTVETCPHYLHLEAETIPDGATQFKCAPPIRGSSNREELWRGLRDWIIDMVVTDHSPCPPAMKRSGEGNFRDAWGGIASLSKALPVMWTEAEQRGFTLSDIARWMSERPAQLAGCDGIKGKLAPGYDADFVVFNSERYWEVSEQRLYHRHPISPYLGETLRGVVKKTYLRGELAFDEGVFPGEPRGCEITRELAIHSAGEKGTH